MAAKVDVKKYTVPIQFQEINISWTIKNFEKSNEKRYLTKYFPIADSGQWSGYLEVCPWDGNEETPNSMSVFLGMSYKKNIRVPAKCKVTLQDKNGKNIIDFGYQPQQFDFDCDVYMQGINKLIDRDDVIPFLKDDTLVVNYSIKWEVFESDSQSYFLQLMNGNSFSDVTLLAANGSKVPAQKCVLVARSPVFAAMFGSDATESDKSTVEAKDIDVEVLKSMLEFIYTGKLHDEKCNLELLLTVADRYAMGSLKAACEKKLAKKIKVSNIAHYLLLANRYNAEILNERALELISKNLKAVLETKSMKTLASSHPTLFYESLKNSVK